MGVGGHQEDDARCCKNLQQAEVIQKEWKPNATKIHVTLQVSLRFSISLTVFCRKRLYTLEYFLYFFPEKG